MQLISNLLYKKNMFPVMQVLVHWLNLMRKKSYHNFKGSKFLTKSLQENLGFILKTIWLIVYVHNVQNF